MSLTMYWGKKTSGAQDWKVGEHPCNRGAVLIVEFEAYPEPKCLNQIELWGLVARYGGTQRAADVIGACEAFVRFKARSR